MLINLSDVLSDQHKTVEETVRLEMEEIRLQSGTYPIISKEPVHVEVEHIRGKELLITAETRLSVMIPCDRCLEDVKREFELNCVKHVDVGLSDAELTEELDESNFIDGYHLDVDKLLFHEILSSWPTKVLCREDCKGLCNVCGQNLNTGSCNCEDTGLDPRMSVVRDLFKNFNEVYPMSICPKNKSSKARRDKRRANWKMSAPNLVKCSKCGELMMPHRVCKACGSYNKREIVSVD